MRKIDLSVMHFVVVLVFYPLRHILGHFGRGQLTYPHCSWASLLGSLSVLGVHSFASNWQLPFLNQWKGENGHRNLFMTKSQRKNVLPDVRTKPLTVCIPGGRVSDRATAPGFMRFKFACAALNRVRGVALCLRFPHILNMSASARLCGQYCIHNMCMLSGFRNEERI